MDSPPAYRRLSSSGDLEVYDDKELSLSYYARRIHPLPSYTSERSSSESNTKASSHLINAILFLVYSLAFIILFDALFGRTYANRFFVAHDDPNSTPSFASDWTGSSIILEDILSTDSCFTSASRSIFCYNAQASAEAEGDRGQSKPTAVEITFEPRIDSAPSSSHVTRSLPKSYPDAVEAVRVEDSNDSESSSSSLVSFLSPILRKLSEIGFQNVFDISDLDLAGEQYEMDMDGSVVRFMHSS